MKAGYRAIHLRKYVHSLLSLRQVDANNANKNEIVYKNEK